MKTRAKIVSLTLAILLAWGMIAPTEAAPTEDDSSEAGICLKAFERCLNDPFVNVNFYGLLGCLGGLSFCFRFVDPLIR
jgi:hypothetical protein